MLDIATLGTCAELTSAHAAQAASSSTQMRALLEHFGAIARPDEGCPKILMVLARLVGQEWIEGQLRIEIQGDDEATTLTIMCEFGVGICERILPVTRFAVPLDEFSRAVELRPALVLPLRITDEVGKMVLTPLLTPEQPADTAPQTFELEEKSLGEGLRKTAPPPSEEEPAKPPSAKLSEHEVPTKPNQMLITDED